MSKLFYRLEEVQSKVEMVMRQLGKQDESFLTEDVRIRLIDQLVQETLVDKVPIILVHDLLRNGCIGFNFFSDLTLTGILKDDIVERGLVDDDSICPAITAEIIEVLKLKEQELLEE